MILSQQNIKKLKNRIGEEHLDKRLKRQVSHSHIRSGTGRIEFYWENFPVMPAVLKLFLRLIGLRKKAVSNSINYKVEEIDVCLSNLPKSFQGFRILQLSDLHIGSIIDNCKRLRETILGINYDLCVITGDFRYGIIGEYDEIINRTKELVDSIQCKEGIVGILGNHDPIEIVPGLENIGLQILLNESVSIRSGDDFLWIAGVDDPHFYEMHNLPKALQDIPVDDPKILLTHSPEIINSAYHAGIDYYICGHTHGGQICLPGGLPILTNSRCSRKYVSGPWKYKKMAGYTSRGTGSTGLPARLFCPPEITLHRLR